MSTGTNGQVLVINTTTSGTVSWSSPSGSTTTVSTTTILAGGQLVWNQKRQLHLSIDEFMKIEDNDIKKRIFSTRGVNSEIITKYVENDEKIAYYQIEKTIKMNNKGVFYIKNFLNEWISYDRKLKKVKISKRTPNVFPILIKDHFGRNWKIMEKYIRKVTPTFCKKVIEGKIISLRNIMEYHRSYTIRRKELDSLTICRFMMAGEIYCLHSIEDPENFYQFDKLSDIDHSFWVIKPFTFKSEEIDYVEQRYREWIGEQDKKLDTLGRLRNGEAGDRNDKKSSWKV